MAKGNPRKTVDLVFNEESADHNRFLNSLLGSAERFQCLTAFAKQTGLGLIRKTLEMRLRAGLKARFVIGLNFYQTDPEVLSELLSLKKQYKVQLFVSRPEWEEGTDLRNFHPKVFTFEGVGDTSILVGSANLTRGGMRYNHEASIWIREGAETMLGQVDRHIQRLLQDTQIVEADETRVNEYARRHALYSVRIKLAKRRAKRDFEEAPGTAVGQLRGILEYMRQDSSEWGFEAQRKYRAQARKRAQDQLAKISRSRDLSESKFLALYEPLVAGIWQSGGLQRGKYIVARHGKAFRDALRSVANIESLDVEEAFDRLHRRFQSVERAGTNVITEILHSLDNQRFAVMNQKSVAGLARGTISSFPARPNKGNVDAEIYGSFCKTAADVRDGLKLKDFTELDALLNEAFSVKAS